MKSTGIISDMQHFSVGDGPGIRTTVFLKGCNLHCEWCHNPETISARPQLFYYEQFCSRCGVCQGVCPRQSHVVNRQEHAINRAVCTACGACAAACPTGALQICGREVQLKEIMDFILDDSDFYLASGGGVTISGGEPLLQAEFSAAIAAECKGHGIHVIIDTAGNVEYSAFSLVAPYTDVFYIDLKGATQDDYHEKTGGSFAVVLANMAGLTADGYAFVARIPVIPGYNDTVEYCGRMADLLLQTGCRQVHLLPFHKLGSGKYRALGLDWRCRDIEAPGMAQMQTLSRVFTEKGFATELES